MDYQFNLRQENKKKFGMSSVLRPASLERYFGTRSNIDLDTCSNDKVAMKPMFDDMFAGFHSGEDPLQKNKLLKTASKTLPAVASFSSSSAMSVSYLVGGIVNTKSQEGANSPSNICSLLDVLVSSFHNRDTVNMKLTENSKEPFPNTHNSFSLPTEFPITVSNAKRTYADVTKGIVPKTNVSHESELIPLRMMNCEVNICSNNMVTMYTANNCLLGKSNLLNINNCTDHSTVFSISPEICSEMSVVNEHCVNNHNFSLSENSSLSPEKCAELLPSIKDLNPGAPLTKHTVIKAPIGSQEIPRINRTSSECSVDSDDSFVVFQTEDDVVCDSVSEEECLSDDLDEVDHKNILACSAASSTCSKNKRVSFRPNEDLVEIRNMVTWDYAHRAARVGPWETFARDRVRFENRIHQLSLVLSPILEKTHRASVFKERFLEKNQT